MWKQKQEKQTCVAWTKGLEKDIHPSITCSVMSKFCDPMDCGPPGSSVQGILQARILEWIAIPFSRGSSWPRDQTCVSWAPALQVDSYHWDTRRLKCRWLIHMKGMIDLENCDYKTPKKIPAKKWFMLCQYVFQILSKYKKCTFNMETTWATLLTKWSNCSIMNTEILTLCNIWNGVK